MVVSGCAGSPVEGQQVSCKHQLSLEEASLMGIVVVEFAVGCSDLVMFVRMFVASCMVVDVG